MIVHVGLSGAKLGWRYSDWIQTNVPKKLKGLSLGLGFQFFEYFANLLQISNKIIDNNKKIWFLSMDLSINFEN